MAGIVGKSKKKGGKENKCTRCLAPRPVLGAGYLWSLHTRSPMVKKSQQAVERDRLDKMARKFTLTSRTAADAIDFAAELNQEQLAQVPQLGDRGKFFSLFLIGESCFLGQINGSPAGS
jgi:hypothetical protein